MYIAKPSLNIGVPHLVKKLKKFSHFVDFDRSLLWPLDNILSHMFQIYNFSYRLVLILILPCRLCLQRQSALSLSLSLFFWFLFTNHYSQSLSDWLNLCCLSPHLNHSLCLPACPAFVLFVFPSVLSPSAHRSIRKAYLHPPVKPSFLSSINQSIHKSTHPPVCLSTHSHPYAHIPGTKTTTFIFRYPPSLWYVSCVIVIVVHILSSTFLYHEISFFL
jgi:hypothetical protein